MQAFQTTEYSLGGPFQAPLRHLLLLACLPHGARRAPEFAVKNGKSVFGQGASDLHLTRASSTPGPRPGFPYYELSEVSPMV